MKLILRLGLILLTEFIPIFTASAQLYGTADANAQELRVPKSVKPAFDYWMRDTWATMFFNPRGAQAEEYKVTCRPGLIPMIYENGKFKPNSNYNAK